MSIWASLDGAPGTHPQVQLRDMDDDDVDTYKNTGPARLTLDVATTLHDGVRLSLWDAHDERLQGIVSGPDLDDLIDRLTRARDLAARHAAVSTTLDA